LLFCIFDELLSELSSVAMLPSAYHRVAAYVRAGAARVGVVARHPCREPGAGNPRSVASASAVSVAVAASAVVAWQLQSSRCEERPVRPDHLNFWTKRWDDHQTGWHLQEAHPVLRRYLDKLLPGGPENAGSMGARMLFPLCGKTVDMAFLSRAGYRIVGIEGVGQAIEEFAAEHSATGATMSVTLPKEIDAKRFKASAMMPKADEKDMARMPQPIILVEGDFLALGPQEAAALVPFEAAFDRGSLVAVDPSVRAQYMQVMSSMIAPGGRVLLVAVERDATKDGKRGPPFEVTEADLRTLCAKTFDVSLLERTDVLAQNQRFKDLGVTRMNECVYLLTRLEHGDLKEATTESTGKLLADMYVART